jgi:hypothetical protein
MLFVIVNKRDQGTSTVYPFWGRGNGEEFEIGGFTSVLSIKNLI